MYLLNLNLVCVFRGVYDGDSGGLGLPRSATVVWGVKNPHMAAGGSPGRGNDAESRMTPGLAPLRQALLNIFRQPTTTNYHTSLRTRLPWSSKGMIRSSTDYEKKKERVGGQKKRYGPFGISKRKTSVAERGR